MAFISLTAENISTEHICCAFSDKKCAQSYELKKQWLTEEFSNGYVFERIDERAKVFIEYGPAEWAWIVGSIKLLGKTHNRQLKSKGLV